MFPGLYGAQDEIARLQKYRMRKMDKCCAEVIYDQIRKRGMENVPFETIMTSRQCTAHCSEEKNKKRRTTFNNCLEFGRVETYFKFKSKHFPSTKKASRKIS
jgi:hypothetical protein